MDLKRCGKKQKAAEAIIHPAVMTSHYIPIAPVGKQN